jgi:hypothetical protein
LVPERFRSVPFMCRSGWQAMREISGFPRFFPGPEKRWRRGERGTGAHLAGKPGDL